ncbi:Hemolysin-type calcium-binding repeat-containing protein [Jannaschia faecimaris]|uniref:Hemolysin-type calcium-binding repeat-containing protein n=1 Tax=Jannaschia faecimaris TaxID=1244108 RepID=A0A1H3MVQ0_9RHOB|nr:calcium-binding protein [Jannaschia faecimaris]SDY80548.1 Hemolysin-type calcium-binding repeat-containing protein [Jannaschia faecimaris]
MLLMAGLVGLFISGVMVALPVSGTEDDVDGWDGPDDQKEIRTSEAEGADAEESPRDLLDPEEPPVLATRDQIGGAHLGDGLGGTSATPIAVQSDAVLGNASDDEIGGSAENDFIIGNDGADTLDGLAGRDVLMGGRGDDILHGGDNDDILHGDADDDTLHGGTGDDLLSGGDGDDDLIGGTGSDSLIGGEGRDTLAGGAGDDFLDGSVLDDAGRDRDDADRISGGDGDDSLAGGQGDSLSGGSGSDLFLLRAPTEPTSGLDGDLDNVPLIEDFDPAVDRIEIDYTGASVPALSIVETEGETGVMLDDVLVARLSGVQSLDASHIRLIAAR